MDPAIRHVWDGNWSVLPGEQQHISVMHLEQYMTLGKLRIPLTSSALKAYQVECRVAAQFRSGRASCKCSSTSAGWDEEWSSTT